VEDGPQFEPTELDEYVAAPDPAFAFDATPVAEEDLGTSIARAYRFTSQRWLTEAEVDEPLWQHWLVVYEPKETPIATGAIIVSGGSRSETPPSFASEVGLLSWLTRTVIAEIRNIPNQPLRFAAPDGSGYIAEGLKEDRLIAFAWARFLDTGNPLWLPRLPMVKAVVRAMDIVQKLKPDVRDFVVMGASKRGWTTWLTGAVDRRVIGIVPIVIDCLNLVPSFENHYAAYGFWAPAVAPYVEAGIMDRMEEPNFAELVRIVDPYSYRERLTLPKYIVNSTGDEFFTPDSWEFYYADLPGEKYLRYVPNTSHELEEQVAYDAISFFHAVANKTPRPEFTWGRESDGSLWLKCTTQPSSVKVWRAVNPDARDFRLSTVGAVWTSQPLTADASGVYRAQAEVPAKGWAALLIEAEFPNPSFGYPLRFTTGVSIVPDTRPYAGQR